ncbi:MAG: ornithine carbamoyltransferase [Myxococcota bacterium]
MSARHEPKDLISLADWPRDAIERWLERARELREQRRRREITAPLAGRSVLLYFEKPSLRTLVTFDVGAAELGAHPVYLPPQQVRLGEREPIEDVARGLARWCDAIVARTFAHRVIEELARWSSVPVINALTDLLHPCQALADALTLSDFGDLQKDRLVYVGDGNNVAHSLIHLAGRLGLRLTVCTPRAYAPDPGVLAWGVSEARRQGGEVRLEHDPRSAVTDAAFVYTDVWTSMGRESEVEERRSVFAAYQVNAELLAVAPAGVRLLHCLPAHRGEEVSDEVLESECSLVFEQAENRLHAQKAVLEALILAQRV